MVLDEFRDGLYVQGVSDLVDRLDHCKVYVVRDHVLHETAVQLQVIDGQVLEITERAQPDAEVVECQTAAQLAQPGDKLRCIAQVGDHRGFRNLETQQLRRDAAVPDFADQEVHETFIRKRLAREVDADGADMLLGALVIQGQQPECIRYHPAVDGRHQQVTLGRGYEGAGADDGVVLVEHADKHFAMRPVVILRLVIKLLDRLEIKPETILLQHVLYPVYPLHLAVTFNHRLVIVLVDVYAVPALFLGDVAGGVGRAHDIGERTGGTAQWYQADADADPEEGVVPDKAEFFGDVPDGFGEVTGIVDRASFEQYPEFVAAQPCQCVRLAQLHAKLDGQLLEQLVTGDMSAGVIYHLEVVEIQVTQRMAVVFLARIIDSLFQTVLECTAIEQAGKRIVARLIGHLACEPAQLGDVMENQHHTGDIRARVQYRGCVDLDGKMLVAEPVQEQQVAGQSDALAFFEAVTRGVGWCLQGLFIDDIEDLEDWLAACILKLPAGGLFGHGIHVLDMAFQIGRNDAVSDGAESYLGAFFLLLQRLPGEAQRGDIADSSLDDDWFGIAVVAVMRVFRYPDMRAVLVQQPGFKMLQAPAVDIQCLLEIGMIVGECIEFLDVPVQELFDVVAKQMFYRWSGPEHHTIKVGLVNGVLHAVKDGCHALFRCAYAFLGKFSLPDLQLQFCIHAFGVFAGILGRLPGRHESLDQLGIVRAQIE